jgi:hypothetical protein
LKDPGSEVEVVPNSVQIEKTTGTYEDAIAFMQRGAGYRRVTIQTVSYKGKAVGYLLTQPRFVLGMEYIEVHLFDHGGKIYFSVWETDYND